MLRRRCTGAATPCACALMPPKRAGIWSATIFDVVLCALELPDGSGAELCGWIKSQDVLQGTPVAMMVEAAQVRRPDDPLEAIMRDIAPGAPILSGPLAPDDFILRPVLSEEFVVRVGALLKMRRYREEIGNVITTASGRRRRRRRARPPRAWPLPAFVNYERFAGRGGGTRRVSIARSGARRFFARHRQSVHSGRDSGKNAAAHAARNGDCARTSGFGRKAVPPRGCSATRRFHCAQSSRTRRRKRLSRRPEDEPDSAPDTTVFHC